jgi:hypothetical protein
LVQRVEVVVGDAPALAAAVADGPLSTAGGGIETRVGITARMTVGADPIGVARCGVGVVVFTPGEAATGDVRAIDSGFGPLTAGTAIGPAATATAWTGVGLRGIGTAALPAVR